MEKKRWEKYKRAMKKLGFSAVGYTYNCQQQKKRTATIHLAEISDPAYFMAQAKAALADEVYLKNQAQAKARYELDYIRRNRSIYDSLFIPAAKERVKNKEENAESYLQYCLDECSHYDDGTYMEWKTEVNIRQQKDNLTSRIKTLENAVSYHEQLDKTSNLYHQILQAQPTKDLLSEINGRLVLELPTGFHGSAYARFNF